MQEKELEIAGGSLYYEIRQNYIIITRLQGLASEVKVPEQIEDLPVREIAKKAFLSKKYLRKVSLPETVEEIGDWAFAYCDNLEQVVLPECEVKFGKAVFLDCGKLKRLYIGTRVADEEKTIIACSEATAGRERLKVTHREAIAALLAAAVTTAQAAYLLDMEEAGSMEWLAKWDVRMLEILNRPDEEGFSRQVLCGEEDYGSTDMNAYMSEKRKSKVRLLLLRCLFDMELDKTVREHLQRYLREHTKGCSGEETWQVILQEHGNDREYYQLFAELGCLNEENFDLVIDDIGENYPEMKAYFMRYKEEKIGYVDFFGELEL